VVVLYEDIFNIEPDCIKDVEVEKTIIDGKIVYEKEFRVQALLSSYWGGFFCFLVYV